MFRVLLLILLPLLNVAEGAGEFSVVPVLDTHLTEVALYVEDGEIVLPADEVERPEWSKSFLGNLIFVILVVLVLFGSAYGIHQYQTRNIQKRAVELERVVSVRTQELDRISKAHEEVNSALSTTNTALMDTNTLLEGANDKLAWANNQLKHTNRALEIRTGELEFAIHQNKELVNTTVHDLKNPLAGIIGLTEILQEDLAPLQEVSLINEVQDNLATIHMAARQMLLNVEAMLGRHGEHHDEPAMREAVYMFEIIDTVLKWNRQTATNKQINIEYSRFGDKTLIYVEVADIQRVLDNLISNAIKFSDYGSNVWIEVVNDSESLWVGIRDEGPGLTANDMERVFGRRNTLSAKPTNGEHSSGYGLYNVKQLIEKHGGEVGVDSIPGEGSTFWFKLNHIDTPEGQDKVLSSL